MNDDIIAFLRENPEGTASDAIAERFLKFKNPNKTLAETAVKAILSKDARAYRGNGELWMARAREPARPRPGDGGNGQGGQDQYAGRTDGGDDADIAEIPWVAVHLLIDTAKRSIAHISLWDPIPEAACIYSVWLKDPAQFSEDDRLQLCDPRDAPYNETTAAEVIEQTARELVDRVPVFLSQHQYSVFSLSAQNHGTGIDDHYLINQLLRAVKEPDCKPLTLENAATALLGSFSTAESAYRRGELFCRIVGELICRMKPAGIENRGQLDACLCDARSFDFAGKEISAKMIEELPTRAGVYGFTDRSGAFIYIGKAVNLRRRIESYFRFNSESPEKLAKLRAAAHGLTIHLCGSELEALIYEYRLIKKHKPPLNSQRGVSERKGAYKPLPDAVILLPHAQDGFCVSVWVRQNQKIKLRNFELNYCEEDALARELQDYFYSGALPASPDDFPELEIVTRWVKRHRDSISIVLVGNMASAGDIVEAMKNL